MFEFHVSKSSATTKKINNIQKPLSLEETLLNQLKELRATITKEEIRVGSDTAHYGRSIIDDEPLEEVALKLPVTVLEFQSIEGIGKTRADKWGTRFINLVLDHIEKHPEVKPKAVNMPTINNKTIGLEMSSGSESTKRKIQAVPFQSSKKLAMAPTSQTSSQHKSSNQLDLQKFAYGATKKT